MEGDSQDRNNAIYFSREVEPRRKPSTQKTASITISDHKNKRRLHLRDTSISQQHKGGEDIRAIANTYIIMLFVNVHHQRGVMVALVIAVVSVSAFTTTTTTTTSRLPSLMKRQTATGVSLPIDASSPSPVLSALPTDGEEEDTTSRPTTARRWQSNLLAATLGCTLALGSCCGLQSQPAWAAAASSSTVSVAEKKQQYDGFADYAKENQMEKSDVACFAQQCGEQTKALFSNPRGIKGVSCLGRCKGEQSCATRCFAEYGSESLNNWLSCTIEENECVKVPKNVDNSAENVGYSMTVKKFDPNSLVGTWYKTDGLNPNYDLFDCQSNKFTKTGDRELDMDIFLRVKNPEGGFWENQLSERMVVDDSSGASNADSNVPEGRTMHTAGKMYGLNFEENWFIVGESDGAKSPPFKLVAYKGHTLQGNYEGAFVMAKEPFLPEAAKPAIRQAAARAGLDFDKFTQIDNSCPAGEPLNDKDAGTGTSTEDWINLVVGEGGVIDWISPGWRGEYNNK